MLLDELVNFIEEIRSQLNLEIELERFYPKASQVVRSTAILKTEVEKFGDVDRFWLLYKPRDYKVPERFMLNVGIQKGKRLSQAQFGAGTDRSAAIEVLRKIVAELKGRTSAGIWVIGETGIAGFVKEFRISEGAKKASQAGNIELVSSAFTQSFQVDKPA